MGAMLPTLPMDWLCGQVAFVYAFNIIQPTIVVDKIVAAALDILVPRGSGESNWFARHWRSLENNADRMARERDIRADLRQWDRDYPFLHHELLVRYCAGFVASAAAAMVWGHLKSLFSKKR